MFCLCFVITHFDDFLQVNDKQLWPEIAAVLGFPSSNNQAPPEYANHVKIVYDEFLADFERQYASMVINKLVNPPQPEIHNAQVLNQTRQPPNPAAQSLMMKLVQANTSQDVMRGMKLPEPFIQTVLNQQRVIAARRGQGQIAPPGSGIPPIANDPRMASNNPMQHGPTESANGLPPVQPQTPQRPTPERQQHASQVVKDYRERFGRERGMSYPTNS